MNDDGAIGVARNDLSGDGVSGILFRNDGTGDLGYYQMQNGALEGWHGIGASSTAYRDHGLGHPDGPR